MSPRKSLARLAAAVIVLLAGPWPVKADMLLGSGEVRRSFAVPGQPDALVREPLIPAAPEDRRVTGVEVVRIIPREGNNPLNAVDPINNTFIDGQVVRQAVDHEPAPDPHAPGPSPGPPPIVCVTGTGITGQNSEVLSFRLDYGSGTCSLAVQGAAAGTTAADYVFDFGNPPVGLNRPGLLWFRSSLGAGRYSVVSLFPEAQDSAGDFRYLAPASYVVGFRNNSDAKEWRAKITVAGTGAGSARNFSSITLTINTVEQP